MVEPNLFHMDLVHLVQFEVYEPNHRNVFFHLFPLALLWLLSGRLTVKCMHYAVPKSLINMENIWRILQINTHYINIIN